MQRMFRVWRLLPPRKSVGAASNTSTRAPHSFALRAAQRAAFPPPITTTSYKRLSSAKFSQSGRRIGRRRLQFVAVRRLRAKQVADEIIPAPAHHVRFVCETVRAIRQQE
jgi:hypothetical protein